MGQAKSGKSKRSAAAKVSRPKGKAGRPKGKEGRAANKRAEAAMSKVVDLRLTKALAHPLRQQILAVANEREISPSEFAEVFDVPLSNVSYHFRELLKFDCIELVREVPVRGSHEHRYIGSRRGLISDGNWSQLGKGTQAGVRIAGFQDLIARCTHAVEAETFDARDDATFYWVGGGLDEIGWAKMQKAIRRIMAEVEDLEVESAQRAAKGGGDIFPTTFAVIGFESPKGKSRKQKRTKAVKRTSPKAT